jgi:hypothetical protein
MCLPPWCAEYFIYNHSVSTQSTSTQTNSTYINTSSPVNHLSNINSTYTTMANNTTALSLEVAPGQSTQQGSQRVQWDTPVAPPEPPNKFSSAATSAPIPIPGRKQEKDNGSLKLPSPISHHSSMSEKECQESLNTKSLVSTIDWTILQITIDWVCVAGSMPNRSAAAERHNSLEGYWLDNGLPKQHGQSLRL